MPTERLGRAVLELVTTGFNTVHSDLEKVGADVNKLGGHADRISGSLSRIGTGLVAAFTVTAVGKVLGDFIEMSDALVNLEAQTGISVRGLQKLKGATQDSDVALEAVAKTALALQKRLGEGKDSFVGALEAVGLHYKTIRQLSPEDALFAVGDAIGRITDQNDKVALGNQLLGKQVTEILPALNGHLKETADAYERMGLVIDDDVIRAGSELDAQWKVLKSTGSALLAQVIGPFIPGLSALTSGLLSAGNASAPVLKFFLELIGLPFEKTIHLIRDLGDAFDLIRLKGASLPEIKLPKLAVPKPGGLAVLGLEEMKEIEDKLTESAKKLIEEHKKLEAQIARDAEAARRFHAAWSGEDSYNAARKLTDEIIRLGGAHRLTADEQTRALSVLQNHLDKARANGEKASKSIVALAIELDGLIAKENDSAAAAFLIGANLQTSLDASRPSIQRTIAELERLGAIQPGFENANTRYTPLIPGAFPDLDNLPLGGMDAAARTAAQRFGETFSAALQSLGPAIIAALQGGGSIVGTIGSVLGKGIGDSLVESFGKSITKALGKTLGGIVNNLIPVVGALLGPLLEKVFGLFGVSEAVKKARTELTQFRSELEKNATAAERNEAALSGWGDQGALSLIRVRNALRAIGEDGARADALVKALLDTDHPDAMRRAMEEINRVLAEEARLAEEAVEAIRLQEEAFEDAKDEASGLVDQILDLADSSDGLPKSIGPYIDRLLEAGLITEDLAGQLRGLRREGEVDWEAMRDAAERYGVDLDSLGGRFQGARLHRSAQEIINDFGLLTRGGADVGGVLAGMGDEIGTLVRDSIKFGTTIPANMRPWIQELSRAGRLLDDQGNKIQNLDTLNFGDELKDEALIAREGFAAIVSKLDELIARITGPLTAALDNITKDRTINIDVDYDLQPVPIPRGGGDNVNVPFVGESFGRGTLGAAGQLFKDFGAGQPAVLHGIEAVITPEQLARILDPRMPTIVESFPRVIDRGDDRPGNRGSDDSTRQIPMLPPVFVMVEGRLDSDQIEDRILRELPTNIALDRAGLRVAINKLFEGRR